MSIDYGEKRIGIAISDPLKLFANPLQTIQNNSEKNALLLISGIIKQYDVEKVIVGLPLNLEGMDTKKTLQVRKFFDKLSKRIEIPSVLYDERYSTSDAREYLAEKGLSIMQSRKIIDQIAAAVILRNFIEFNRKNENIVT